MLTTTIMTIFNELLCVVKHYYNRLCANKLHVKDEPCERFVVKTCITLVTNSDEEKKDDDYDGLPNDMDRWCLIVEPEKAPYPLSFVQIELKDFAKKNKALKINQQDKWLTLFVYDSRVTEKELKEAFDEELMFQEIFLESQMFSNMLNGRIETLLISLLVNWLEKKLEQLEQDIDSMETQAPESTSRKLEPSGELGRLKRMSRLRTESSRLKTMMNRIRGMVEQL
jgi:hypothetical protein